MKFIETKREELRRERIALNEQEWPELVQLLKGAGEKIYRPDWSTKISHKSLWCATEPGWVGSGNVSPTITLVELKAKYFESDTREPNPGDWGYFWDDGHKSAYFSKLIETRSDGRYRASSGVVWSHFSHTIPSHIQEAMKEPGYEVVYSFGESSGQIVVDKEIEPGLYAGTRGGVNVVLKRITP